MPQIPYFLLIIVSVALGGLAQAYISSAYKKWARVPMAAGVTGAQAARAMLDRNGLQNIGIERIAGQLTDHYDPRAGVLRLSEAVYDETSVASVAVASHEAGHAVQRAKGYVPIRIREALVPVVQIGSNFWIIAILIGFALQISGLVTVGLVLFAFVVAFQIVTLPVEFDASSRALDSIQANYALQPTENNGAKTVLRAAAMTYVAAALVSVLQLLYFLGQRR